MFKSFECYREFFNKVIKPIPIEERNYHQENGAYNQQLGIDIDIDDEKIKIVKELGLNHKKIKEECVPVLREFLKLPKDMPYEMIDRTRKDKISFHIRFACNFTYFQYTALSVIKEFDDTVNVE